MAELNDPFLKGGGEMGALARGFNWAATPLGMPGEWPAGLQTMVGLVLHAQLPMLLIWGKDRTCFYNDAYRESLSNDNGQPAAFGGEGAGSLPVVGPLIERVFQTGEAGRSEEVPLRIRRNGRQEELNRVFSLSPVSASNGSVEGVLVTCIDTARPATEPPQLPEGDTALAESEARFRNLIRDASVGLIVLKGSDMIVETANEAYCRIIGHSMEETMHRPLFEVIPGAADPFLPILRNVLATGEPFAMDGAPYGIESADGVPIEGFISFVYQPYREADGTITGVMAVAHDVTEMVRAQQRADESINEIRAMVESAPFPIGVYTGREMRIRFANQAIKDVFGKGNDVEGKLYPELLPELAGQDIFEQLAAVYETGIPYHSGTRRVDLVRDGKLQPYYFHYSFTPLFDAAGKVYGVMNTAAEVTDLETARQRLLESEARFRHLIEEAPVATCLFTGREMTVAVANEPMISIWGKTPSILGSRLEDAVPELKGQPFFDLLDEVFATGKPYHGRSAPAQLEVGGVLGTYYFDFTYKPLFDESGAVYGIINMAVDVTEQTKARRQLEQAQSDLRNAIEIAELGTWEVDLVSGTVLLSARHADMFGLDKTLLSFEESISVVHPDDHQRVAEAFANALVPGSDGKYEAEYRIVNVRNKREQIIHAQGVAVFEDGKAVRISGTSRDITIQHGMQVALETEVQERTEELAAAVEELRATNEELGEANNLLAHSNDELAQYAYVASHDLQEPLRKIRFFTDRLAARKDLPEESVALVEKVGESAARMSTLIKDLLEFSRLLKSDSLMRPVDLSETITAVIQDFELTIAERDARITVGDLPTIMAVGLQMNQLFYNLLSNALKFTATDTAPRISVSAAPVPPEQVQQYIRQPLPHSNYCRITITDNGIGFDSQYSEQIFEVFRRLHGRDHYPGSGIGLALCRRIVVNHHGYMYAESQPGAGTSFHIILPETQEQEGA